MCTIVFFQSADGGVVRAHNKRTLRDVLGAEPVCYALFGPVDWTDSSFLCGCDISATIAKAPGFDLDRVDEYGDVWVRPNG